MVRRIEGNSGASGNVSLEGLSAQEQAQLVMMASNTGNPNIQQLLEQLRLVADSFKAGGGAKADPQIAAQGRNLNFYTDGPGLDAVASGGVLQIGQKGQGVKDLQKLLNSMGANLDEDGKFGPKTEAALRSFQAARNLPDNGVLDGNTLSRLQQGGDPLSAEQWGRHQPDYDRDRGTLDTDRQRVYGDRVPVTEPAAGHTPTGSAGDRLFSAITGQESGGSHSAVNGDSGALGIGQVMPANVRAWSREALGYEISPETFASRPDLQNQIVRFKLDQYYNQGLAATGGNEREAVRYAAAKWYSGDGNKRNSTRPQMTNGNSYPSIAHYSDQVLNRFLRS